MHVVAGKHRTCSNELNQTEMIVRIAPRRCATPTRRFMVDPLRNELQVTSDSQPAPRPCQMNDVISLVVPGETRLGGAYHCEKAAANEFWP